jgi:hypothetical protein
VILCAQERTDPHALGASLGWFRRRWGVPDIASDLSRSFGQRSRRAIAYPHFRFIRSDWIKSSAALLRATATVFLLITAFTVQAASFAIGDRVQANAVLNVRSTAAGTLLGTQPNGASGTIVAGPTNATLSGVSYTWWDVSWANNPQGWVVQDGLTEATPVVPTPVSPSGGTVVSTLTPTLSWSGGSNFSSLQINVSKSPYGGCPGGPNCVFTSAWLSATTTFTTPTPALVTGTNYRWDVTACSGANGTGTCVTSTDAYFSTQAATPVSPTPISPSGGAVVSTLTPTLSWSGGSNFSSLQINMSQSPYGGCPGGPNCVFTSAWLSATTTFTTPTPALVTGTNYRWDVTACSGASGTGTCVTSTDAYFSTQAASQPILSVSPANPSVAPTASSISLVVSNKGGGTMSYTAAVTNGSWLAISSGGSGGNSGIINVSYSANTGAQRSGTIQITANGATGSPANVIITQAAVGTQSFVFGFDTSACQQYTNCDATQPFNGITNWAQAATTTVPYNGQTISFVILRATRGNPAADSTGNCQWQDPLFTADATAASQTSLKVGAYHLASIYTDATQTEDSPEAEADAFVKAAGNWIMAGNMRPFLDLENDTGNACFGAARMSDPTLTTWVDRWMQEVIKQTASVTPGGVTPIIYTYSDIADLLQSLVATRGYEIWYRPPCAANNPSTCNLGNLPTKPPWTVALTQYNWFGQILSMAHNADMDAFQGDQNAFQAALIISSGSATPVVTQQPLNQSVAAGQTATFTATAAGTPTPTVQWQQSTDNGASFQNISGATSNTFSFSAALTQNGYQYRAVFSNSAGSATTQAAALTVIPAGNFTATVVASSANPSTFGQSVTFTATVTSSGGTPTGTVTFYDSATQLGTGTLSNGTATSPATSLSVGSHSITAIYGGDSNFASSNSSVFTQIVLQNFALTVNMSGSGTVTSSPSGINCSSTCSVSFTGGAQVSLTATPASGWSFTGWGGACGGVGACSVTMNAAQSVSATFSQSYTGGAWTAVTAAPSTGLSNPLLLTDGTVIVHISRSQSWYKLTPDAQGNYASGTWSPIASLQNGYTPLYFASAVLPDGRVIIQGGEYNANCSGSDEAWTNLGAIYDPVANTWTPVSPPSGSGWTNTLSCGLANGGVGDAPSIVLPNGTFMLGSCCACPNVDALLNATSLTYSSTGAPIDPSQGPNCPGGTYQAEQGYTLLPNGNLLTIDVWNPPKAQQYNPAAGTWADIASTPVSLIDPTQCGKFEMGPAVTRADGTTVAFGGNSGCTSSPADPTAIYTAAANSWVQGPNVPAVCGASGTTSCTLADAPAALLPSGNILFAASAGYGNVNPPTHFFEFSSGNTINQVADPPFNPTNLGSFNYNFLVLPNGQIFMTDFSSVAGVYTPSGSANAGWAPVISSVPNNLAVGQTYQISGSQLNGLSQGAAYGDDVQSATNYPLVRITNNATGHVFYARTFNHSTMSIAPNTMGSTNFTVPANIETGANSLVVVANGIASQATAVNISNSAVLTVSVTGSGTVTSNPSGINCTSTCSAGFSNGTNVTLTATANSGYTFANWTQNGSVVSTLASYPFTLNANTTLVANFTQTYTISVSASPSVGGTVSGNGTFPAGSLQTVTATANSGYTFTNWTQNGSVVSTSASYPFTLNANTTLVANFTQTYTISVSASPSVGGTVSGGGAFPAGSSRTVTATANSGYTFNNWTQNGSIVTALSGYTFTLNANTTLVANFTQLTYTLTVSPSGNGSVTSSPAGISCPSTCSTDFYSGTQVTLTATPANGFGFSGWGGACSGVGNCVVTMNAAQSVTATFAQTQYTLNVSVAGNGSVTSSPSGISCPSVCTMNYASGTPVMLTASPAAGATFNGWGGACTGTGICLLTMNTLENVTAMFSSPGGGGPSARSFVSATLGNDSNPCTRAAPCLTFAAALNQTTAGGEIDVLDPGDFGPVTITEAISIEAAGDGGVMTAPGTSAITIRAGANDTVNLSGLIFDGANGAGTSGVVFSSGSRLIMRNCVVQGFTTSGIAFTPGSGSATTAQLTVQDTTIVNNGMGIWINPTGGIAADVTLRWLRIDNNIGEGLRVDSTGSAAAVSATLADSSTSFNGGIGIDTVSGAPNATLAVSRIVAVSNGGAGIRSAQAANGIASVTVGNATVRANAIGLQTVGGGSLLSYGNNQVTGNASNGSFTGGAALH